MSTSQRLIQKSKKSSNPNNSYVPISDDMAVKYAKKIQYCVKRREIQRGAKRWNKQYKISLTVQIVFDGVCYLSDVALQHKF